MNHCRYCAGRDVHIDDDGVCEQCISEEMHRQNDPHAPVPGTDNFDDLHDDDRYEEDQQTGVCDDCGDVVYGGGYLCDRRDWMARQGDPGEDGVIGLPPVKPDGTEG